VHLHCNNYTLNSRKSSASHVKRAAPVTSKEQRQSRQKSSASHVKIWEHGGNLHFDKKTLPKTQSIYIEDTELCIPENQAPFTSRKIHVIWGYGSLGRALCRKIEIWMPTKEPYNFQEPTNRSHLIVHCSLGRALCRNIEIWMPTKEPYNFQEPTNRSHLIVHCSLGRALCRNIEIWMPTKDTHTPTHLIGTLKSECRQKIPFKTAVHLHRKHHTLNSSRAICSKKALYCKRALESHDEMCVCVCVCFL